MPLTCRPLSSNTERLPLIKAMPLSATLDKTKFIYSDQFTISDTPLEIQVYVTNKKSALEWVEGALWQQRW